jgi:hypothetical protein
LLLVAAALRACSIAKKVTLVGGRKVAPSRVESPVVRNYLSWTVVVRKYVIWPRPKAVDFAHTRRSEYSRCNPPNIGLA